jgi:N-acyl-D-aspartate/D-glutamate deacylase
MAFDLVIRGGTVADGRGGPLYTADVAISDGLIAEVGKVGGKGRQEIDADGLLVAPGFVDIHSHYDGQAIWDERLLSSGWHGVTTTVMGNCGLGFAPVRMEDRDLLIEFMEGVEDIPAEVLRDGLSWEWSSFPEYLDALERRRHDMDVCTQLPHSALRVFVMGERAARREEATVDDVAEMRRLAAEAMRAGALGFATSRSFNHRSHSGEPIPSMGATLEELIGIGQGLNDADAGVMQMILNLSPELQAEELQFTRRLIEGTRRPLSITVLQRMRFPEGAREVMEFIAQANKDGFTVRAQTTPRPLGTLFGLDMTRHPFMYHPSFRAIADKPLEERVAAMRDPEFRARLLAEKPEGESETLMRRVTNFDYMFDFGDPPNYAPGPEDSFAARAKSEGRDVFEIALDVMLKDDGHNILFAPNSGLINHSVECVREMLENPHTVVAVSDGGAHVAHISDISFSTFLLTYWGRDRPEGALDVGWVLKRMTKDTADAVGLYDRGVIAPGYKADINVIDHDRLTIEKPYMAHDLPMGAKRLLQRATGYVATIVSGEPVYREGDATGELPGKLVRGAQPEPAVRETV